MPLATESVLAFRQRTGRELEDIVSGGVISSVSHAMGYVDDKTEADWYLIANQIEEACLRRLGFASDHPESKTVVHRRGGGRLSDVTLLSAATPSDDQQEGGR